jgi:hypothetical protein
VLFGCQMFRSYGAWSVWVVVVYKHLVPLGPKTTATLAIVYKSQGSFATVYCDRRTRYESRLVR